MRVYQWFEGGRPLLMSAQLLPPLVERPQRKRMSPPQSPLVAHMRELSWSSMVKPPPSPPHSTNQLMASVVTEIALSCEPPPMMSGKVLPTSMFTYCVIGSRLKDVK